MEWFQHFNVTIFLYLFDKTCNFFQFFDTYFSLFPFFMTDAGARNCAYGFVNKLLEKFYLPWNSFQFFNMKNCSSFFFIKLTFFQFFWIFLSVLGYLQRQEPRNLLLGLILGYILHSYNRYNATFFKILISAIYKRYLQIFQVFWII